MKYSKEYINQIIHLYNNYLYKKFSFDGSIEVVQDGYQNDQLKFHRWNISPICIANQTFSSIQLSDNAIGDILFTLSKMPLEKALELNEEIIKNSLK